MPRSLADGHIKLSIMSTEPADPKAPTVTELEAGVQASAAILASDFKLGPVASDTVSEPSLEDTAAVKVMGASNFEGNLTLFRMFDEATGAPETGVAGSIGDSAYQALNTKGGRVWIGKRFTSKEATEPWLAADEVEVYEVEPDNAQDGQATGYIKKTIPLQVNKGYLNGAVAGP